jgi:succinate dehydrogenase/fumarate reductase flavoprotein subunit
MMPFKSFDISACDVLIIGGGGAGLRAAIEAKERGANVIVVSKSRVGYGNNTFISKGTFAAATGWRDPRDNPGVHMKDSVIGGCFINEQRLLKVVTQEAGAQIAFLEKCGIKFFKRQGKIMLTHTPGHSYSRHVRGEHQTGRDFTLPLREYARRIGIRFIERVFITKIFTSRDRITAATGITQDGRFLTFTATCIILATGGFAQVYLHNNNAAGMTGDGHALAFELGIPLKDMEFIQFYPTALGTLGRRLFLYEAFVFQAGAVMRNAQGEDIVAKHGLSNPMVMTRDRLTRAIMHEIMEGRGVAGGILIDLTTIPEEKLDILRHLLPVTIPPDKKELIVSPTTHFCMGGIIIDENAETSIQGLFAAGEVCAGVHGANRLGGNALTEVFTMGGIAGKNAALRARDIRQMDVPEKEVNEEKRRLERLLSAGEKDLREVRQGLTKIMWFKAGIIRKKENLIEAMVRLKELTENLSRIQIKDSRGLIKYLEVCNMLLLSEAVCRAALVRTESRGAHYRSDYPKADNNKWLKNIIIHKQNSKMNLKKVPVSLDIITL